MENQKLLAKLPDWLISRWNREATREMKQQKRYPDFKTFTAASNPNSSCNAEKEVGTASVKTHEAPKPKDVVDMTVHSIQNIEGNYRAKGNSETAVAVYILQEDRSSVGCML